MSAAAPNGHNCHWFANLESNNALTNLCHPTGDLVAKRERRGGVPLVELRLGFAHYGYVRVTQATAAHLDKQLASAGRWFGHVLKLRRLLRLEQTISEHLFTSSNAS